MMYKKLETYIQSLDKAVSEISDERRKKLGQIAEFIQSEDPAKLTFICTHNSRRSHLCQIWAATLADHFGLDHLQAFSGGTEATAFNPRAVAAVKRVGFKVENPGGDNPHYQVSYADDPPPLVCFSKTFDDPRNPQKDFAAIMTCSDADQNCPFVPGASFRASIPYVDPKEADGTPEETQTYDERCYQIATEMYYMMSLV
jgi:protein-tyrosine-phosphatase